MSATCKTDSPEPGMIQAVWGPLVNADTNGDATQLARWGFKSVQAAGTWGSAGGVTIQGSNDGTNWTTLTDSNGDALVFTANGLRDILQNTRHVRAIKSAADAALSVTVTIIGV